MSATQPGPTHAVAAPAAARLEFRVRIPAVVSGDTRSPASSALKTEPTRGMEVLNGILDKRSRSGWKRFAGRRGPNRIFLLSAAVIGLSGFALIFGLTNNGKTNVDSSETDVFANDDFESETSVSPVPPQITPLSPAVAKSSVVAVEEQPQGSAVQAAVYHTTETITTRTAWLDGTIIPDDSREP